MVHRFHLKDLENTFRCCLCQFNVCISFMRYFPNNNILLTINTGSLRNCLLTLHCTISSYEWQCWIRWGLVKIFATKHYTRHLNITLRTWTNGIFGLCWPPKIFYKVVLAYSVVMILTFNWIRWNFTNQYFKNQYFTTRTLSFSLQNQGAYNIVIKKPHLDKGSILPVNYFNKICNGLRCSKIVSKIVVLLLSCKLPHGM